MLTDQQVRRRRNVRRTTIFTSLLAAALGLAVLATPAEAIVGGAPDGSDHPYVGESYNGVYHCSGELVSSRVYVTAAHCFSDTTSSYGTDRATGAPIVGVTFASQGIDLTGPRYFGDYYYDPQYTTGKGLANFDDHDVAVIIFNQAVPIATHATLPTLGEDTTLPSKAALTVVGYGYEGYARGGGGQPQPVETDIRAQAPASLDQTNGTVSGSFIKLAAQNANNGTVCSGDSGGPDLLAGTNVVLAENSFVVSGLCSSIAYSYRLDTPAAQNFIYSTAAAHGAPIG